MSLVARRSSLGFTLVELLIAATMVAILILGISGQIHTGLSVWKRTAAASAEMQVRRNAMNRLSQDFLNALVYEARDDESLYGDSVGKLDRPAFDENRLAWYTLKPEGRAPGGARFVSYSCQLIEEEYFLVRTEKTIAEVRNKLDGTASNLLPGCTAMRVRYAYRAAEEGSELQWHPLWNRPVNTVPAMIEIQFEIENRQPLRRVMSLPAGLLEPFEQEAEG